MSVHLQEGLYDLCRLRIAGDEVFKAQAVHCNFQQVDDALFDEYRLFQLRRTLNLVYDKSPFYRRLFDANGVTPDTVQALEDLGKMPFTTSRDLSGTSYSLLCTSQSYVEKPVTFYSSGSTGTKKRIFFSKADVQKILDFLPRGMNTVVDRDEGRVQVFLQNSQGRGIGQILADSLRIFGMQAWTSDLGDSAKDIANVLLDNHINVWFGEAITILRATRILSQSMDLSKLGMKCVFITMTNIPDCMVKCLEKTWNCRVSTHYGLTESGWGLAVDCDTCPGYHYDELNHLVEVVDPETGEVLPYGETGEVVLTNLARDCMPLIRYRTGDIAALHRSSCGSHLDVLGHIQRRTEGAHDLGEGNRIYPAMFDEPIFIDENVLDYRLFADDNQLYLDIEALNEAGFDTEGLENRLMELEPLRRTGRRPVIRVLPSGALRSHCFEKKKILPLSEREG